MIIIAGHSIVDEDSRDKYILAFRDMVERCRAFDGCIEVAITADSVDPKRVNNLEIWRDASALDAWRSQANAPDLGIEPDDSAVKRYNAEDGGSLF